MSTQLVSVFSERLYGDKSFASALEHDPLSTLRNEGFADLATAAERDRDRIGELVERLYADDEFRGRVEQDPIAELIGWGLPEARDRTAARSCRCSGRRDRARNRGRRGPHLGEEAGDGRRRRRGARHLRLRPAGFRERAAGEGPAPGESGGDGEHAGRATCTSSRASRQAGPRDDPDQQAGARQGSDQQCAGDLARRAAAKGEGPRCAHVAAPREQSLDGRQPAPARGRPRALRIFEPDREPEEPCGHACSFPASPSLDS